MKYTSGKIKAVHVLKFENNDDLIAETETFIIKKKIKTAFFMFLGGMRKGDLVSGPKKPVIPPVPFWHSYDKGWDVFGVGSVFLGAGGKPQIHIHSSLGSKKRVKTGCMRKNAKVFIVVEALMFELSGVKAEKGIDPATGINTLYFK